MSSPSDDSMSKDYIPDTKAATFITPLYHQVLKIVASYKGAKSVSMDAIYAQNTITKHTSRIRLAVEALVASGHLSQVGESYKIGPAITRKGMPKPMEAMSA